MKLYQIVQKDFALLGISPNQPNFDQKSVMAFLIFSLGIISGTVFLFFKANTFLEYTQSIYATTTIFDAWIGFIIFLVKKEKILELMNDIEKYANEKCEY